jgi:hypothetical protein
MISDVLFEARESILRYLAAGIYGPREEWADIAAVVLAMDKLRMSPGYDLLPGNEPIKFPDDPMEYLDTLMEERSRAEAAERIKRYRRRSKASVSRFSVTSSREALGVIHMVDGVYVAIDVDGTIIGRFASLLEAAQSLRGTAVRLELAAEGHSDGDIADVLAEARLRLAPQRDSRYNANEEKAPRVERPFS